MSISSYIELAVQEYAHKINENPDLLSVLYDADLLPEQIRTVRDVISMVAVCEAYNAGRASNTTPAANMIAEEVS